MSALPKRQNKLSHTICKTHLQHKPESSVSVSPPYYSSLRQIGSLHPLKNRNRCLEILGAAGAPTVLRDFSPEVSFFSKFDAY